MRRALAEAAHHAAHRSAFGRRLAEQPLMQAVLADLALEMRGAPPRWRCGWRGPTTRRPPTPARAPSRASRPPSAKYWVCKRAPAHDLRGDGVPRRERLRRGVAAAAPLPRGAGQRDLGRLGQRDLPRRAARHGARARERAGAARASCASRAARTRPSTPRAPSSSATSPSPAEAERARARPGRAPGARARGVAAAARRRPRPSPRPSAPRASRRARACCSARCRRASTPPRSSGGCSRPERGGWPQRAR